MPVGRGHDYAASGVSGYLERIMFMADGLCVGMELGGGGEQEKSLEDACCLSSKSQNLEQ